MKSFLGLAVYFIDHIRNYANIVRPLHKLIHDDDRMVYKDADENKKAKRWKIAIQGYDRVIEYLKGELNVVTDEMSRLLNDRRHIVAL